MSDLFENADFLVKFRKENPMPTPGVEMTEDQFRRDLIGVAETYSKDIGGDYPDIDNAYEHYVYQIDGRLVGYIYMGEAGEWAFIDKFDQFDTCDEPGTQLHEAPELLAKVKALSPYKSW
jgi:hypothetical protein